MPYPEQPTTNPNDLWNGEREIGTQWADFSEDHLARYAFVKSIMPPQAQVLDVGCGVGYGSAMLAEQAKSVTGLDYRQHVIAFANNHWKRTNVTFLEGDALNPQDYPEVKYDVIVAFEIIEHLPDDAYFLEILANHLKPNGFLCVSAPNIEAMPQPEDNPWHYRHYERNQFYWMLKKYFSEVAEFVSTSKGVHTGGKGNCLAVAYNQWWQYYTLGFVSQEYPSETQVPSGGIGTYTQTVARMFANRGHTVHVISRALDQANAYTDQGVSVHRVVDELAIKSRLANKFIQGIDKHLQRWQAVRRCINNLNVEFDLVESAEWCAETLLCRKLRRKVPTVVRLHTPSHVVRKVSALPINWRLNWAEKINAQLAYTVTAPSEAIAAVCKKDWRLSRINILANPMDIDSKASVVQESFQTFGYLPGRFDAYKGFPLFAETLLRLIKESSVDMSFLLVGRDYTDALSQRLLDQIVSVISHAKSQTVKVEILPRQNYTVTQALMNRIDGLIMTSRYENMPYVALEAMAKGCLVIAPRVGGLPEMIENHSSGLLFEPDSVDDLISQIIWAYTHPAEVFAIRQTAIDRVRQHFSVEHLAATFEVYYAHIIGNWRLGIRPRRAFGWWLPQNGQLLPDYIHRMRATFRRKAKR